MSNIPIAVLPNDDLSDDDLIGLLPYDDDISGQQPRSYFTLGRLVTQDEDVSDAFRKAIDEGETVQVAIRRSIDGGLEIVPSS